MVAIGPLQAQTVFACSMMDRVMDECCCGDHASGRNCIDSDCDATVGSSNDPCCERSVEVNVDEDTRQDTRIAKPLEIRSDVDPPQAILASSEGIAPLLRCAVPFLFQSPPDVRQSGSNTYLITQRLRI